MASHARARRAPSHARLLSVHRCFFVRQAKGKTSEAITKLCQLAPPTAILLEEAAPAGKAAAGAGDDDGSPGPGQGQGQGQTVEREVPTELVHRGDVLKVR